MQNSLSEAEQKLAQEKQSHEHTDGATVDQISNMMDELNQARMLSDRERKSREKMEHDSHEMLQAIVQELATAQDELAKEVEQRQEIEEKDLRNQKNLRAALTRAKKLTQEQKQYQERLETTNRELDQAKCDAENFARSEAITKEQLIMLQEKLNELESAPPDPKVEQELENARREAQNYARAEAIAQEQVAQLKAQLSTLESLPLLEVGGPPIVSSLPLNHPVMRAKMKHFMARLFQHLELMETSFNQEKYLDLVVVCNWLKSETQSMGIEEFMEPTHEVELLLRKQEFESIPSKIAELKELAHRIEFDENAPLSPLELPFTKDSREAPDTTEVFYDLPTNEKKAELLENFISQVGFHLMEMQADWQEQKV